MSQLLGDDRSMRFHIGEEEWLERVWSYLAKELGDLLILTETLNYTKVVIIWECSEEVFLRWCACLALLGQMSQLNVSLLA